VIDFGRSITPIGWMDVPPARMKSPGSVPAGIVRNPREIAAITDSARPHREPASASSLVFSERKYPLPPKRKRMRNSLETGSSWTEAMIRSFALHVPCKPGPVIDP
jgi:hypothetical protein